METHERREVGIHDKSRGPRDTYHSISRVFRISRSVARLRGSGLAGALLKFGLASEISLLFFDLIYKWPLPKLHDEQSSKAFLKRSEMSWSTILLDWVCLKMQWNGIAMYAALVQSKFFGFFFFFLTKKIRTSTTILLAVNSIAACLSLIPLKSWKAVSFPMMSTSKLVYWAGPSNL